MKKKIYLVAILIGILSITILFFSCNDQIDICKKDISIECSDGSFIKAQIITPENYKKEKLPLVTLGHGYGGNMDSAGGNYLAEALARSGFATIRMDYNHCCDSDLSERTDSYSVNSMIDDQLICINYMVENFNVDSERIGLYGRSLGGRVAMKMANENEGGYNYRAIALVAPAGNKSALEYYMHGKDKWKEMLETAEKNGYVIHQDIKLTPEFFYSVDDYVPSEYGNRYDNPVLVIYNTLDNVVLPETSIECADAYRNSETVEITSDNGHGYEMGYKESETKDMLISKICDFFKENL